MSADGRQLDPEIAALLREVPSYQGLSILADPQLDLRGSRSFRSAAPFKATKTEQHLLDTYREQVAWLLRQASVRALWVDQDSTLVRYVGVDERLEVPLEGDLGAELQHYRRCLGDRSGSEEDLALAALSESMPLGAGSASRLAAASLKLVDRDDTRIGLAMAMLHERQAGAAKGVLLDLIARGPQASDASIAWNNLGTIYLATGLLEQAREAFRESAELAPLAPSAISWLLQACKLGDEPDALRAASHLGDLLPAGHPAIEEHVQRRVSRLGEFPDAFWSTTRKLQERVGPTARRVMDV